MTATKGVATEAMQKPQCQRSRRSGDALTWRSSTKLWLRGIILFKEKRFAKG
jgi:hypothetical protein